MKDVEIFKKAVNHAFEDDKTIIAKLNEVKKIADKKATGIKISPEKDSAAIIALCKAIDDAIKDNHLDWNASDLSDDSSRSCKKYRALFEENWGLERGETKQFYTDYLRISSENLDEKAFGNRNCVKSCHSYDTCFYEDRCPNTCSGNHFYLNELDHLLHYLAVRIWLNTTRGRAHTAGLTAMKKFITEL